jgi:hypothetical protein
MLDDGRIYAASQTTSEAMSISRLYFEQIVLLELF